MWNSNFGRTRFYRFDTELAMYRFANTKAKITTLDRSKISGWVSIDSTAHLCIEDYGDRKFIVGQVLKVALSNAAFRTEFGSQVLSVEKDRAILSAPSHFPYVAPDIEFEIRGLNLKMSVSQGSVISVGSVIQTGLMKMTIQLPFLLEQDKPIDIKVLSFPIADKTYDFRGLIYGMKEIRGGEDSLYEFQVAVECQSRIELVYWQNQLAMLHDPHHSKLAGHNGSRSRVG